MTSELKFDIKFLTMPFYITFVWLQLVGNFLFLCRIVIHAVIILHSRKNSPYHKSWFFFIFSVLKLWNRAALLYFETQRCKLIKKFLFLSSTKLKNIYTQDSMKSKFFLYDLQYCTIQKKTCEFFLFLPH